MIAVAYAGCFLALATLAGFVAASGPHWLIRLPVVAATPILAIAVWWQLGQRDGWPAGGHPADGSSFIAGLVQSPTPQDPGAIYVWTQPPGSSVPRAFRLKYSTQLERRVDAAARAVNAGQRVGVHTDPSAGKPHPVGGRSSARVGGGHSSARAALEFYRLPPPGLQAKGHP
jgi:hypothetical protein